MLLSAASNEYRGKASKMRESNSVRDKMIDRNWVKKRKRKRIPCGLDLSKGKEGISQPLESPRNNSSAKRRLKGDFSISRSTTKKKGNDGYYFECVICDLGGNLLCCDSCPRTYHLQCLNPPLKRTPPGKWQCPNCCDSKGSVKPINHPDTISRRARTKTTVEKSKTRNKPSCSEKLSFIIRRSIPGKNRSSSKGKPASSCTVPSVEKKLDSPKMGTSCIVMPSHSPDGRCTDGISTCADTSVKKKINSSCINASIDRKSSSHEEVQTSDGILESDPKDELSEVKSDLHCSNSSPEKKLTPIPDLFEKSRKRKQKIKKEDNKKKPKSEKGKWIVSTISKHVSKVAAQHPETSKHRKKRSSVDKRISLSISKEDATNRIGSSREQDEKLPEETLQTSHGLDDLAGKDKATREESTQDGVQQVDRILGCRVQSCDVVSPSIKFVSSPAHPEPESHSIEPVCPRNSLVLLDQRSHDKPSEDNPARIKAIDMNTGKFLGEGCHITMNQVGGTVVDDVHMNRTLLSKDSVREGDVTASTAETMENQGLTTVKGKTQEEPISSKVNTEEVDAKEVYEENANIELVDLDIPCSSAVSECNARIADDKLLITKLNESAKMNSTDTLPKESLPMNREDVIYEFLVKWVGKSHIRNSWVSESQLKILAKRKLENYKAKYGTALINICQEQWSQPQRVIALRDPKDGATEVLVKWRGLPYDECTWERLDEPIIEESTHLTADFKKLECQAFEKNALWDDILRTKGDSHQSEIATLIEQPEELKGGSLFPHQLEALNWLRKCWSKSKNVILADEMGLGKTVSACAFLSSLYFEFKVGIPSLVLVPLSTMPNWLAEFALWAPDLNVVEYHGSAKARSVIRQYEWHASVPDEMAKKTLSYKFHVLLTTYEMVLADSSHLRGVPWEVLVVDEGHRLKNSGSKLFSLLNTFSFQHRVLLTGTPLQNNIGEMYNLLNFLQPTSFPSLSSFEEKFNDLTTAEKVEELKKLVAPHMLRRLKKDAMQNIPPKTERMVPVELSSIQAEYYRAMLTKNYQILRNIGKGVAQQSMLNIVMQLRKVCNHPYLIPGTEPESGSVEFLQEMRIKASAKLTLLHSMLKLLKEEGHRVLIFSQMTKLLDILEDYLTVEFGPKTFERVDGSVSVADRQAAIARFNQDKTRFVFLLSTRSCGLGINLATADTVIIYDSDFNPHADIQAMNRAHRIGQSKRLLVYRLVVRASVEERILQLAKKKLMLDQLFVNKSESQKDVEDILRWGTEELFSGCAMTGNDTNENASSKTEVASETESRQKRRAGGLGDVYKDRCTDGNTMIVWDENAILRLLDRSNLQSGYTECTEGELDSDMLGSVKSVEWNDEPNEEPGSAELPPTAATDVGVQSSEKKEDHAINGTEENEWDRLLRLRWEKYKSEEAAALGRGKRLRKAVSYKEAFAPHPSEALSETGNDDEPEPEQEQEPEPEYTPAGRALKAKYAKLRARQKERLAQRYIREGSRSVEDKVGLELPTKSPNAANREIGASLGGKDPTSAVSLERNKLTQLSDEPKDKMGSITKLGRLPKYGYKSVQSSDLDLSVRPPGSLTPVMFLPSHQPQATCMGNSMPASNLLPVLGLCAPNANHVNSARNFKSYMNLSKSHLEHSRIGMGVSDFPFQLAPNASTSIDEDLEARETTADGSTLPDTSAGALHRGLKNNIKQSNFPFNPFPSTSLPEIYPDPLESSGDGLSASQGKLVLPNLALDEKSPAKFPLPSTNMSKSHPDFLPSLSLGMKGEAANVSGHDLLTMPLLPNFRQQMNENLKQSQQASEVSPILGRNQTQGTYSSLPEKHKKVLENIMMRTGSGTSNSSKKRSRVDVWSEDELDALWIGVRRHGWGNWHVMLRDSKLKFSKYRTIEDLSDKWEEEQLKILGGPSFPVPKSTKTTTFPLISDGMMTRALLGSKLAGRGTEQLPPPKFHSHLTDIQLGYGDLTSSLSHMDPIDPFYLKNDHSSMPVWKHDKLMPNLAGDYHAGPSTRSADLNLLLEQPFLPNSMAGGSLGSLSMNHSGSSNLKEKEEEQYTNKYLKLPSLLDKSLNWLRDSHNNRCGSDSGTKLLPDPTGRSNSDRSSPNDDVAGSSSTGNKLPHWLREAVSAPPKQPEPDLPPTVSAIAHSVRLLYGEEKPTIPPFTVPGPPPFQPKDPRKSLKKRRRLHKLRRLTPDVAFTKSFQSNLLGDNIASSSIPPAPPFPSLPPSTGVFPWIEPNLSLSSLPSSSFLPNRKKGTTMSPSPEVLHLVASCVAPGPHMSLAPANPGSSFLQAELPPTKAFEPYETGAEGGNSDVKGARGKRKARRGSLLGNWGHLPEERVEHTVESGDSSKTQSDPHRIDRPEGEEISSEETVSDDRRSEHE